MDSITTLIVEDEPMLAEILVDTIKQFPSSTLSALRINWKAQKKMLRLYQPQLILLDNFLPDGKGLDLIRRRQHQLQRANHFLLPLIIIWIPSAKPCVWGGI